MYGALPQRPEDRVAETQHHQVLHRFLAEIMVDAVDLRFGEMAADRSVDCLRRRESWPSGFSSTTRDCRRPARTPRGCRRCREEVRRSREVKHPAYVFARNFRKIQIVACRIDIDAHVLEESKERVPGLRVERLLVDERFRLLFHELHVLLARPVASADRDDAGLRRQVAVQMRHVKRRQELACGQVAGTAENDHVDRKIERS